MKQLTIEKTKMNPTEEDAKNLEKEFGEIKDKEVRPATRTIEVYYKHCCGCGCRTENYRRVVPFDSPLQDGNQVKEVLDDDFYLGRG